MMNGRYILAGIAGSAIVYFYYVGSKNKDPAEPPTPSPPGAPPTLPVLPPPNAPAPSPPVFPGPVQLQPPPPITGPPPAPAIWDPRWSEPENYFKGIVGYQGATSNKGACVTWGQGNDWPKTDAEKNNILNSRWAENYTLETRKDALTIGDCLHDDKQRQFGPSVWIQGHFNWYDCGPPGSDTNSGNTLVYSTKPIYQDYQVYQDPKAPVLWKANWGGEGSPC